MTRRQRFILFVTVWLGFGLLLLIGGRIHAEQPCANCRGVDLMADH